MFPVIAQAGTNDPLTWVYLALAAVFGLIFIGLVAYLVRTSRAGRNTDLELETGREVPSQADLDDDLEGDDVEAQAGDVSEMREVHDEGTTAQPAEPSIEAAGSQQGEAVPRSIREQLAKGADASTFLARFVENTDGETVGETVGIDEGEIILKGDEGFYALTTDEVLQKDGDLVADPNVDWDAAREAGEAWRQAQEDAMRYDDEGMPVMDD